MIEIWPRLFFNNLNPNIGLIKFKINSNNAFITPDSLCVINQTVMKITVGSQNFDFKGESIKSEGFLKYEKQEWEI